MTAGVSGARAAAASSISPSARGVSLMVVASWSWLADFFARRRPLEIAGRAVGRVARMARAPSPCRRLGSRSARTPRSRRPQQLDDPEDDQSERTQRDENDDGHLDQHAGATAHLSAIDR